ncbi:MAG TPA: DUF885 domain-containing protein [Thermoleophilia bacterium]|nr:DUF885 domain-containing protein [Thermoleophilia bacterium]
MSGSTSGQAGAERGRVAFAVQALLDGLVTDDPVLATTLGLREGAGRLPSWSEEARGQRVELLHAHERALTPLLEAEDAEAAVDAFAGLQVVRRRLRALELLRVAQRHPGAVLDVVSGIFPLLAREIGSVEERVAAVAGRLGAVPDLLEEAKEALEPGLSAAAVESGADFADGLLDLVGDTVQGWAGSVGHAGAVDGPSAAAAAALEGYRDHLRRVLAPTASAECGAGEDVLADVLRWEHCLDESAEELAAYGREVLDETRAVMEGLAAAAGYADAADAVAAAQAVTPSAAGLVAAYTRAVEEARDFVVAHDIAGLPEGEELEVVATPAFLRTLLPFAAYDAPGPFAERQLGFYYVTPPPDDLPEDEVRDILRGHAVASLRTTGVHEAYPGHHLQLVSANKAPTLARRIAGLPDGGNLLVEGWAFYCEELMDAQGFLDDPVVRLVRLNDQVWRACRVVIDVELHLGRMGLQQAVDFLVREARMNRREAELECRRYAEEPGQAMSYLLGKREVVRLANTWRAVRHGSLRAFHDELLSWGSVPPAVIAWGMGLGPRPAAARVTS